MLTRGEKGVLWASAAGLQSVPALPVQVVDSVGAGDAFNAGLAVGLSEGRPVLEAIALGVTAASLSTQHRETIESYYRRAERRCPPARVVEGGPRDFASQDVVTGILRWPLSAIRLLASFLAPTGGLPKLARKSSCQVPV